MKNRRRMRRSTKWIFILLILICVAGITISTFTGLGVFSGIASTLMAPMQSGIDSIGQAVSSISEDNKTTAELKQENEDLQSQIDQLNSQLNATKENYSEYQDLLDLLELSEKYPDYEMTGARIISKDAGNWYTTFTINKGSLDGLKKDMNVIADNGLVGIITDVYPSTSIVRSILDDRSSVSGMIGKNYDNCYVDGDLTLKDSGQLKVDMLSIDSSAQEGDEVVTSYISDKFMPGIVIGYITDITPDDNNLTYSAKLTPVVDFQHLSNVLVIKELKSDLTGSQQEQTGSSETETGSETETETETASETETESGSEAESGE